MKYLIGVIYLFNLNWIVSQSLTTPFENNPNYTVTLDECINYYKLLDKSFKKINVLEAGNSDIGRKIHLVVIDQNGYTSPVKIRKKGKIIIWITNGIHPGEPEGIDASMMLARDLASNPALSKFLDKLSVVIIPIYNVDGAMRRNNTTRVNQNGPEWHGFRGNGRYLDLNRDFVKQDSRNARTFAENFQVWKPDIFIDNHTTNGADYPYNVSILASMKSKLSPSMEEFFYGSMLSHLYQKMKNEGDEMIPYVEHGDKMENGLYAFNDKPRFSSGYATLFHSFSLLIETHMLKEYSVRVNSTYRLMNNIIQFAHDHQNEIAKIRQNTIDHFKKEKNYTLNWNVDLSKKNFIPFKSYKYESRYYPYLKDSFSYFNRKKMEIKQFPFYQEYLPKTDIEIPKYYVIPQAYDNVIQNLKRNGIEYIFLEKDTNISTIYYKIADYKTMSFPYENHYLHYDIQLDTIRLSYPFTKGDIIVPTQQAGIRYIMETLEPNADDSFLAWNFFDGILMRKEYYSDYLFVPIADELLREDKILAKKYQNELQKESTKDFKISQKLDYIYKNSKYAEPYYSVYPVARIF